MVFVVSAPLPIGVAGAHACEIEPSCCDGSDEPAGVCPNICKQVGEEYRKQNEALLKIRKTVRCVQVSSLWVRLIEAAYTGSKNTRNLRSIRAQGEDPFGGFD